MQSKRFPVISEFPARGKVCKNVLLLPSIRFCFHLCPQVYTKNTEQIPTKHGWRVGFGPEKSPLTFGADTIKRDGSMDFFSLSTSEK